SRLMTGSTRTNEKGKAPAYANSIFPNTHPPSGATFLDGNVDEDNFDSILDMPMPFAIAGWEDIHRSVAPGVPETIRNPRVNRDVTGSSFVYCPIDTAPVHTRNNINVNTNQSGLHGKFEGSFLSLGLGGTSEPVSSSQLDSREVSDKLKEAASNELKIARARKATSQAFDDAFMGPQINYSGFSNQYSHVSRMTSTNNEFGCHGGLNSGIGSSPHHMLQIQQNGRQLGRGDNLIEGPSTELKMVNARKATGQTLDADFTGFQRNNSGFSDQFSNVDRMTSTNYEAGVHSTLNSVLNSSRQRILHMQQYANRNLRSCDMDRYKGDQSVVSATVGGNSAHFLNSQQHNLKPPESVKPPWMTSSYTPSEQLQYFRSTTVNSPNYAGQVISQNTTPNQVLGGNLYSQRTKTPQVSWVGTGPAGIDAPFPKRLGVESSVRNSPRSSQGHLSPMGTGMQTANTGQMCQFSDKGSIHIPHNVLNPLGRSDGAPVSYPMSYQEPFFTYGQSENALIQRPKGPQGAPSTNASSMVSQSQKLDFHVRPHHKRTAVTPQSASHWVQRQKISHPTVHHSMPKPPLPVTTALVHPSIPGRSRAQHAAPVASHVPPVIPCVSNAKTRVPVASAPAVSHIKWKDPNATSKLSGHKCFLCKRDLALTSEGQ
ncbi:hypothetical protein M8C21_007824, partial [Ambrosia artemisiifolia]